VSVLTSHGADHEGAIAALEASGAGPQLDPRRDVPQSFRHETGVETTPSRMTHLAEACHAGTMRVTMAPDRRDPGVYFAVVVTCGDGCRVVHVRGELDLAVAGQLTKQLCDLAGSDVVVDLSDLTFIDAAGLRALVTANHKVRSHGHQLTVRGAHGLVRRVFEVTRLAGLFED